MCRIDSLLTRLVQLGDWAAPVPLTLRKWLC